MNLTTIFANLKNRARYLLKTREGEPLGLLEIEWAMAICEELERMTERIEKLEKREKV